ncbi:MAG: methyltransferase domain-containing protein [Planctomycetes bacterium]|nr:methyltransferase domain-containing protein [Planctomycetota bacterium]
MGTAAPSSPIPSPTVPSPTVADHAGDGESMLLGLRHHLERRGLELGGAPRARLVEELRWYQGAEALLDRHMNRLAAAVYGGKHPKHWLWKSHKQFILDRVRPGERVLDVGCGASAYLLWMAEKGCKVTAIDRRRDQLDLARSIMSHPNLSFELRDAVTDPPSGEFDVAICSHVIEHIDDPVPLLANLRRWAPRLIVAVPPDDNRWQKVMFRDLGLTWKDDEDHRREYTPALLRQHLTGAGWNVVDLHAGVDIKATCVNPDARPRPLCFIGAGLTREANLGEQRQRSEAKKTYDSMVRSGYLAQRLIGTLAARGVRSPNVLCVGARNRCELDCLVNAGAGEVTGIDLHSTDPRIRVMDMHRLGFADGSFDAVFSSHSLEHAMDPALVASEFQRVVRPDGVIIVEVPTGFTSTGVDHWDFLDARNLAPLFDRCEMEWSETGVQLDCAHQRVIRAVFRVKG